MQYIVNFIILVFIISSCDSENQPAKLADNAHEDHIDIKIDQTKPEAVRVKDDRLNAVYQQYILLTNALIKGDVVDAKIAANAIETGAKDIKHTEKLRKSASTIMLASQLEEQRTEYSVLSNEFIALVKMSGLTEGQLYVDFCPMALNNKGAYWLSNEKEIKNPYYGEEMLTCGEIKDTIK